MGSSVKRGVRVVVVVVVLSIMWLQLALPPLPHEPQSLASSDSLEPDPSLRGHHGTALHSLMQQLTGGSSSSSSDAVSALTQSQIWEVWEHIIEHAGSESIHNLELYGPVQQNTVVIVVQVHNRLEYLRHLIVSLAEVRNIDTALLMFSHDYYDENINKLIMTIDFCKVMQVFYPHTLQLHPTGFPGHTEGDCPRDTNPKIARQLQCRGNPDLYGHYREPRYTQTKHHWWWKANKVFESVLGPMNHTGLVLFLEEDHYVSEDLLHMLTLLAAALPHACPQCHMLTLGNYLKNYNWPGDAKKVEISPWLSSKHNMGFAFNRSTWQKIQACGVWFCTHDDYNWDWSLQHVSNACLQARLHTMVLRAPRVFHIGECGVHHRKKDCSSRLVLNKAYRTLQTGRRALFPLKLIIMHAPTKKLKKHKGNGGWGDHRDQELCKSFLTSTGPYHPLVREPVPPIFPPGGQGEARGSGASGGALTGSSRGSMRAFNSSRGKLFPNILPMVAVKANVTAETPWMKGGITSMSQPESESNAVFPRVSRVKISISQVNDIGEDVEYETYYKNPRLNSRKRGIKVLTRRYNREVDHKVITSAAARHDTENIFRRDLKLSLGHDADLDPSASYRFGANITNGGLSQGTARQIHGSSKNKSEPLQSPSAGSNANYFDASFVKAAAAPHLSSHRHAAVPYYADPRHPLYPRRHQYSALGEETSLFDMHNLAPKHNPSLTRYGNVSPLDQTSHPSAPRVASVPRLALLEPGGAEDPGYLSQTAHFSYSEGTDPRSHRRSVST